MSRIRTVKPEFFRHEGLQDLEAQHPGKYVMLVFAGLWTQCDCNGVFPWRPRQLKLDILPFLPFDMAESLEILRTSGQIHMYEVDGRAYGQVPTFHDHQRLSGKEAQGESRYPTPDRGKHQGSDCEAEGKRQDFPNAQERELEREREKKAETALLKPPPPPPPPKAPVNPFEAFGKDAMHDLAPSKTSELTMDVANNLVASGKFPEVHTWIQKQRNMRMNDKAILHTLTRCYMASAKDGSWKPWPYCDRIIKVENGTFNEQDYVRCHA